MLKRKIIPALVALLALTAPAAAQSTKAQLNTEVSTNFPDNTTGLITPAILRTTVNDFIASWQQAPRINAQVSTLYTVLVGDYGYLITFSNTSPVAVSLPQATGSFATFNFMACNRNSGAVTITPTTSTINGAATLVLAQNQCTSIISDGTNYQVLASGVQPVTCAANNWISAITTALVPTCTQPSAANLSNGTTGTGSVVLSTSAVITTPAITGGSITGLSAPTVSSDAATKGYVDGVAVGLISLVSAKYATAAVLPNTPSYANGASGVGATLTSATMTALVVDGVTPASSDRVLVKNQASALENGVYTVTTVGSGGAAWVLTRATDFDTAAEMLAGSYILVTAGDTQVGSSWILQTTVATVGASSVNWNQFAVPSVSSFNTRIGAVTPIASDYGSLSGLTLSNCMLTGTVGASALTIALKVVGSVDPSVSNPCVVPFRHVTPSIGVLSPLVITAATSLVISSGSTLATANGIPFRIWITGHQDAGTFRLGAIKASSDTQFYSLDESLLVSSTAEGGAGGADSAGVFYTGTAVSSKAYRVLGFMTWESGLATAGTWSAGPDVIQLYQMGMAKPGQPIGNSVAATTAAGGTCTTSSSYVDSTLTATITPKSAANYIQGYWTANIQTTAANQVGAAVLRRGSNVIGIGGAAFSSTGNAIGPASGSPVTPALVNTPVTLTVGCLSSDNVNPVIVPAGAGGISGQGGQIVLTELQG